MSYIPPRLRVSHDNKPEPATPISEQPNKNIMPYIPLTCTQNCTFPQTKAKIMPYIPPHLRQLSHEASSSTQHPHLSIRSSSDIIYRFIVLLHHQHMSCQHVTFTQFEGNTYTHLQLFQLYTLTADLAHPSKPQYSTEVIEQIRTNPANVIFKAWKEDLKQVLEKFGRFVRGESRNRILPVILLRFGRILFRDHRGFFDWGSSQTPENLERNVETRILSKTFGLLSREEFVSLRKLAHKDALHIQLEDKITIQVEDKMRPGSDLWCTCYVLYEHNEQSVNSGSDDVSEITGSAKHVLELKKVTLLPVRHMIGDVACVGKSVDIRLAFIMEEYPLTEMELCDLKSYFNKASIDGTTLHLPLDSMHSTSGRFKVVGCAREIMKVVTDGGLQWYFHTARNSYQAYVEPIICQEFCEGRKEWNTEKAILCIEELLQRVWADCII